MAFFVDNPLVLIINKKKHSDDLKFFYYFIINFILFFTDILFFKHVYVKITRSRFQCTQTTLSPFRVSREPQRRATTTQLRTRNPLQTHMQSLSHRESPAAAAAAVYSTSRPYITCVCVCESCISCSSYPSLPQRDRCFVWSVAL